MNYFKADRSHIALAVCMIDHVTRSKVSVDMHAVLCSCKLIAYYSLVG